MLRALLNSSRVMKKTIGAMLIIVIVYLLLIRLRNGAHGISRTCVRREESRGLCEGSYEEGFGCARVVHVHRM